LDDSIEHGEIARRLARRIAGKDDGSLEADEKHADALAGLALADLRHDGRPGEVRYLARSTLGAVLEGIRRRRSCGDVSLDKPALEGEAPIEPADPDAPDPAAEAARLELLARLRGALEGLRPRWREVLTRELDGEPTDEIAAAMNISAARVHQIRRRALGLLRRRLEERP
jgi:RNA polymerase sigma factor (sigma-70 family)